VETRSAGISPGPPAIADLLERNERRRADRRETWRQNDAEALRRAAAYERIAETQARATGKHPNVTAASPGTA
jgi:hypothetical protein